MKSWFYLSFLQTGFLCIFAVEKYQEGILFEKN